MQPDAAASPSKKGGRRKSAFAEEEEGYMFVEEGFRIRFANGETIDFYADNAAQKSEWMAVLAGVIGKPDSSSGSGQRGWTDLVMRREQRMQLKLGRKPINGSIVKPKPAKVSQDDERPNSAPKEDQQKRSMLDVGSVEPEDRRPAPLDKSPRHAARMRGQMTQAERRAKTRSMMF